MQKQQFSRFTQKYLYENKQQLANTELTSLFLKAFSQAFSLTFETFENNDSIESKNQTNQLKSWITHYKLLFELQSQISAAMVTAPTLIGGYVFRIVGNVVFKMEF